MFENLQENITILLRKKKKSKKELAEYLDIHPGSINRALRSKNVTIDRLAKIAHFIEMDFFELLEKLDSSSVDSPDTYSKNRSGSHRINDSDYYDLRLVFLEIIQKQQLINENLNEIDKKIAFIEKLLLNL